MYKIALPGEITSDLPTFNFTECKCFQSRARACWIVLVFDASSPAAPSRRPYGPLLLPLTNASSVTSEHIGNRRSKKSDIWIGIAPLSRPMYVQASSGGMVWKASSRSVTAGLKYWIPLTWQTQHKMMWFQVISGMKSTDYGLITRAV